MSYAPTPGRFIQRDPLGYVDGANVYLYVGDKPTANVDPSGLELTVSERMIRSNPVVSIRRWLNEEYEPGHATPYVEYVGTERSMSVRAVEDCSCPAGFAYAATANWAWEPEGVIRIEYETLYIDRGTRWEFERRGIDITALETAVAAFNTSILAHERHHAADAKRIYTRFSTVGEGTSCVWDEAIDNARASARAMKQMMVALKDAEWNATSEAYDAATEDERQRIARAIRDALI